jgi:drug/metabolite transporter (DMT)-like permease
MIGLFLLSVNEAFTIGVGELWLLACALLWTVQIMLVDVSMQKGVPPLAFSMYQFLICGVLGVALGLFIEPECFTIKAISGGIAPLLYAGVLSVGVAFTLQSVAQKRSDPTTAAIIFSTEALFGTLGGAIILREVLSLRAYVGCAVMFAGLVLSQLNFKKKKSIDKTKEV